MFCRCELSLQVINCLINDRRGNIPLREQCGQNNNTIILRSSGCKVAALVSLAVCFQRQGIIETASPCPICRDEYLIVDHKVSFKKGGFSAANNFYSHTPIPLTKSFKCMYLEKTLTQLWCHLQSCAQYLMVGFQ